MPPHHPAGAGQCSIFLNIELGGPDVDSGLVESIGDCCEACKESTECVVFAYCPDEDG